MLAATRCSSHLYSLAANPVCSVKIPCWLPNGSFAKKRVRRCRESTSLSKFSGTETGYRTERGLVLLNVSSASTSAYVTPVFWERLWRTAGAVGLAAISRTRWQLTGLRTVASVAQHPLLSDRLRVVLAWTWKHRNRRWRACASFPPARFAAG